MPGKIGMPAAVYLLSAALSAYLWGYLMEIIGRRGSLLVGLFLGMVGSGMAFYSVIFSHWVIFLGGLVLVGFTSSVVTLSRFTAAEVHTPATRGRAISSVVLGGAVGAVVGPQLVGPLGRSMTALGLSDLSGAYAAGAGLFAIAFAAVLFGLHPEPRDLGRKIAVINPDSTAPDQKPRSIKQILKQPAVALAIFAMLISEFVMVVIMAVITLHLRIDQYALVLISLVISIHTFGMYALSFITGDLVDHLGRVLVILLGAGMLVAACVAASLSAGIIPLTVSLFFVGLGWNLCFIGGSALLADQLPPAERARSQGFNDLLLCLSASVASFTGGLLYDLLGLAPITLFAALVSGLLFIITLTWARVGSPVRIKKTRPKTQPNEGCQSAVDRLIRGRQVGEPC